MIEVLVAEPFWVPLSEIRNLTDRQCWEVYILPRLKQQKKNAGSRPWQLDGTGDQAGAADQWISPGEGEGSTDNEGRELDPEATLRAMVAMRLVTEERAEAVIKERREWLARQKGE